MTAYLRAYEINFASLTGEELKLRQNLPAEKGLAIEFDIVKKQTGEPQTCSLKIYNPSEKTIAIFTRQGTIEVKAGYSGDIARIFHGTVNSVNMDQNGVDTVLSLDCLSHIAGVQSGKTFPAGTTNVQVINSLIDQIRKDTPSITALNPPIIFPVLTYSYGHTISGDAFHDLQGVLDVIGYKYFIENGTLSVIKSGFPLMEETVIVSPKSGLIGYPKQISEKAENGTIKTGIEFVSLLNYSITLARTVALVSKRLTGTYPVDTVRFRGNSFQGDWVTEVRLLKNG